MPIDADPADLALVGDLVARERRSERLALHAAELDRTYSYFDLCNTAYKVGNVLSHRGVREGDRLVVDPTPLPEPVLTFLGAALLGAVTEFDADPLAGATRAASSSPSPARASSTSPAAPS
ncbi:hypothetical protein [Halobaculum litoreum]|uniref:AMP-binding enzyme n=1 Tax=Halobaculum litoreum TaxID=3031998 RepID=A0ABD5XRA8_9EURY|nr:hypothetical protein [Halobaculum sp. DT92]